MNMNHIINLIVRQVVRRLVNHGMRAGLNKAGEMADRRKAARGEPVKTPQEMTAQERQALKAQRQQARRAQQGLKAVRRIGRL